MYACASRPLRTQLIFFYELTVVVEVMHCRDMGEEQALGGIFRQEEFFFPLKRLDTGDGFVAPLCRTSR